MYSRKRRKMHQWMIFCLACELIITIQAAPPVNNTTVDELKEETFENNVIDSDSEYDVEYNKKYGINPSWQIGDSLNKNTHKYTIDDDLGMKITSNRTVIVADVIGEGVKNISQRSYQDNINITNPTKVTKEKNSVTNTTTESVFVIPISTRQHKLKQHNPVSLLVQTISELVEHEPTTNLNNESSTQNLIITTELNENTTETIDTSTEEYQFTTDNPTITEMPSVTNKVKVEVSKITENENVTSKLPSKQLKENSQILKSNPKTEARRAKDHETTTDIIEITDSNDNNTDSDDGIPVYTELDYETDVEVPEDYYDAKDLVPTAVPNTDALSVLVGFAGNVAESVAERLLPKTIFDLYKRMQKQNEAIEAERLRSREENGGLGQFGRGILKSISTGITRPFNQLMAGVRDIGSLDSDRGFVGGLASGVAGVADSVSNVANSVSDAFKDRVQAIFPGTLWCGDGHSATARSHELGLFFLTDTCCRQHDACKLFIRSGQTQYGLTNTGLFTRSHCSCDANFRSCLKKTNSLVSSQIGITYFNVLGPQCFRKSHPIVRCVRRTRITGQKCEEYEVDYSKPKMWQWFDSETF